MQVPGNLARAPPRLTALQLVSMLTYFKEENAMTETTTTTEEHAGEAAELGLCIVGAATDRRC